MKPYLFAALAFLACVGVSHAQPVPGAPGTVPPTEATNPGELTYLADAIKTFNRESLKDPIGKQQPPLNEAEVVAAIRLADRNDNALASDALFSAYRQIARTRKLPQGAEIEVLTGLDPGGDFIFDTWYVRIRLPKEDGGSYAFTIRERIIGSHSVGEVAEQLEARLKTMPPFLGRYRLEERLQELKARAAKATAR